MPGSACERTDPTSFMRSVRLAIIGGLVDLAQAPPLTWSYRLLRQRQNRCRFVIVGLTVPFRLNAIARYPSSLSSYSHGLPDGSESVRGNSIGPMNQLTIPFASARCDRGYSKIAVTYIYPELAEGSGPKQAGL